MKTKAFIMVPQSEASAEFLASLPHDTQIAVVPDDQFVGFLGQYDTLVKEQGEEFTPEPNEEEELLGNPHEAGC